MAARPPPLIFPRLLPSFFHQRLHARPTKQTRQARNQADHRQYLLVHSKPKAKKKQASFFPSLLPLADTETRTREERGDLLLLPSFLTSSFFLSFLPSFQNEAMQHSHHHHSKSCFPSHFFASCFFYVVCVEKGCFWGCSAFYPESLTSKNEHTALYSLTLIQLSLLYTVINFLASVVQAATNYYKTNPALQL